MVVFIEAPFPDRASAAYGPTSPPYEATVATRSHAIGIAPEPGDRMSFLTREKGALEFVFVMVGWMLRDPDKTLLPATRWVARQARSYVCSGFRTQRVRISRRYGSTCRDPH